MSEMADRLAGHEGHNILAIDLLPDDAAIAVASRGLMEIAHLGQFFGGRTIVAPGLPAQAIAGWGNRKSGAAARSMAAARNIPHVLLEDGFMRSVGLGKTGAPAVSIVVDDEGIYYDARTPCRLERLLADGRINADVTAGEALNNWRAARISKYNLGSETAPDFLAGKIVLVDQVRGDESIAGAGASEATFDAMLAQALAEFAAGDIVVRTHPDVAAGKARGYLASRAARSGLRVLADDISPHAILDCARAIWTVSSGLGFESILRGVPVRTFAAPFYAGWGLTEDCGTSEIARAAFARRGRLLKPEELFAAAFLDYARYADPVTRRPLAFAGALDRIVDWKRRDRANAGVRTICFGFSRWKRKASLPFLGGSQSAVEFRRTASRRAANRLEAAENLRVAVWGMRDKPGFAETCQRQGIALHRVEDGFLRSVGLGSDLRAAGSLVIDGAHLYYDASAPGRLETILQSTPFTEADLAAASRVRQRIVREALTKYNLRSAPVDLRQAAGGRKVAIVVEQVPGDAALRLGGGRIGSNLELLQAVRNEMPDAFIVYKEHPDLVAGNRRGRLSPQTLSRFANQTISEGDLETVYRQADVLHVISSLAGFEALIRNIPVQVWGKPWYAGWGLTEDRCPIPRRQRRLTIDELVAGALILYPAYADPVSGIPCGIEDFLTALGAMRRQGLTNRGFYARQAERLWRVVEGWRR